MTSKIFLIAVFTLFIHSTAYATCSKSYTLGFFNGVWNTRQQASDGKRELQDLIGSTYNNEPVKYENFYNHTGATVDSNGLQDLAETFIQRSSEIDKSGVMGKRFEYFWEFLGSSEPTFLDKIKGIFPNAASLFDALYTTFATKLAAIISSILSNPPTEADYATHNAALDALAADGQKLMLVGHSQGNLFMNHAYDHILPVVTKDRVAAAHIVPASITLNGDYVLTDIDLVINAMRVQGGLSVPDNNLDLNSSSADVSGHTLIGTYLDGTRAGRGKIKTMIETGMGKLHCPEYLYFVIYSNYQFSNDDICYSHLNFTSTIIQRDIVMGNDVAVSTLTSKGALYSRTDNFEATKCDYLPDYDGYPVVKGLDDESLKVLNKYLSKYSTFDPANMQLSSFSTDRVTYITRYYNVKI